MSNIFKLNIKDVIKSSIVFLSTSLVGGLIKLVEAGGTIGWIEIRLVLYTAIISSFGYLVKNLFTNSDDKLLVPENKL
jgi:hypothetical protein